MDWNLIITKLTMTRYEFATQSSVDFAKVYNDNVQIALKLYSQ